MFCILLNINLIILIYAGLTHSSPAEIVTNPEPYANAPRKGQFNQAELDVNYWREIGINILQEQFKKNKLNTNKAKNIIFFLGDGMSVPTITAARMYKGQLDNKNGEEDKLFFETFPYTGMSKTYSVDKQVSDSACTATAYLCGVKANSQTAGVSAKVKVGDCAAAKLESNRATSIVKWAQDAGKATGVVTTTRITHASPSGAYAHIPHRDMECDTDVIKLNYTNLCDYDIAMQMVLEDPGKNINVLMGGGRNKFLTTAKNGSRHDQDLIEVWKKDKADRKLNATYVTDQDGLDKIDPKKTDYLLGLFAPSHMNYTTDRPDNEPPLWKMTKTAIEVLQKEKNGFFLFVEGGLIDVAHHDNQAKRSLIETIEFAKAIEVAARLTSEEDTLIVVTADHAHTMSVSGYAPRGTDILNFAGVGLDKVRYTTISYANGPGYTNNSTNPDLHDNEYRFGARVPLEYETHGGDDVLVYARGPWAHLFSGSYEQNYIPIAESYAAGIGPGANVVNESKNASTKFSVSLLTFLTSLLVIVFKNIL